MVDHDGMSSVWRQNQMLSNRVLELEAQILDNQRKLMEMRYLLGRVIDHWSSLISERESIDGE